MEELEIAGSDDDVEVEAVAVESNSNDDLDNPHKYKEDRQEEVDEVITPHRMFLAEPPTLYNCHNRNIELT